MNINKLYFISILSAFIILVICNGHAQVNLALNKSVSQSSTYSTGIPEKANDGVTNGSWSYGSVIHTYYDQNAWWEIDLGKVCSISRIEVWNRTDCCGTRLGNFYIFVSDVAFTSQSLTTTLNQSGVWNQHITTAPNPDVSVTVERTGRYIRVQLAGTNYLSLAEVKILGPEAITFQYDNSGNRENRTIVYSSTKSAKMHYMEPEIFEEIVEETKFRIYPNPTDGLLQIEISNLDTEIESSIKLFDLQGRKVYENNNPGLTNAIDISERNPGVYILMLQAGSKTREWKIIKE